MEEQLGKIITPRTNLVYHNYQEGLLRYTLQALEKVENHQIKHRSIENQQVDRELYLAIRDMLEDLLGQENEEIRLIAKNLSYLANSDCSQCDPPCKERYPKRAYEAIIALYKITFFEDGKPKK